MQQTWPLAPEFQAASTATRTTAKGGRIQFDDGANDGWLRASTNDNFPIGFTASRTCRSRRSGAGAGPRLTATSARS